MLLTLLADTRDSLCLSLSLEQHTLPKPEHMCEGASKGAAVFSTDPPVNAFNPGGERHPGRRGCYKAPLVKARNDCHQARARGNSVALTRR